jgi:hypothetical protein
MKANHWRKVKTISQGQTDDLKKETEKLRIWVSRCEVNAEGLPLVTEERLINGKWLTTATA